MIAVVASLGGTLLLLSIALFIVWSRHRRQHTKVPTEDPEVILKQRVNRQTRPRDSWSIDSITQRPLLQTDTFRTSSSDRNVEQSSTPREPSNLRYAQVQYGDSGNDHPSIQLNLPSAPLFDKHGKDQIMKLPTGLTILSPTPNSREDAESVNSVAAPSTIDLPNPFAESLATSSTEPSTLSRTATDLSVATTFQAGDALVHSPTELATHISHPAPTGNDSVPAEAVSPVEILPVPAPAKLHPVSLVASASSQSSQPTPTSPTPRGKLPSPPTSASRQASVAIRPLPRTPTQKVQLTRTKSAKSQTADMRIAVLNNAATSKASAKHSSESDKAETASIYSQASAARSEWSELTNPHDHISEGSPPTSEPRNESGARMLTGEWGHLVNPHDRNVTSIAREKTVQPGPGHPLQRARPRPRRTQTADSALHSPTTRSGSTFSWDRYETLSPVSESDDPASAAVSMRFALAQAVEAARRDSLYHAELEKQQQEQHKLRQSSVDQQERPTSGTSAISEDVEKFEKDMQSWLASPRVASPRQATLR